MRPVRAGEPPAARAGVLIAKRGGAQHAAIAQQRRHHHGAQRGGDTTQETTTGEFHVFLSGPRPHCPCSKIGGMQLQVFQDQLGGLVVHVGEADHAAEQPGPLVGVVRGLVRLPVADAAALRIALPGRRPDRRDVSHQAAAAQPDRGGDLLPLQAGHIVDPAFDDMDHAVVARHLLAQHGAGDVQAELAVQHPGVTLVLPPELQFDLHRVLFLLQHLHAGGDLDGADLAVQALVRVDRLRHDAVVLAAGVDGRAACVGRERRQRRVAL